MSAEILTPPPSPTFSKLFLCADGGGSKVCVVIRSSDGIEVRGIAGPCNIQSVGYELASQSLLLATYRALSQLSSAYLPFDLYIPPLSPVHMSVACSTLNPNTLARNNGESSRSSKLPSLNASVFQYAWLGLAGVNSDGDAKAFISYATNALSLNQDRIKLSNDVNLLAAPALGVPNIDHVVTVVAGTGAIGRTIKVSPDSSDISRSQAFLPLEEVAVASGWGYLLGDEGSAFSLGRMAIRSVLAIADRQNSSSVYSSSTPRFSPLHNDILRHFGTTDPTDLITIATLTNTMFDGMHPNEATAKRNAMIAGSARIILKWAFPEDQLVAPTSGLPTPPGSLNGESKTENEIGEHDDIDSDTVMSSEPEIVNTKIHFSVDEPENLKSHKEAKNLVYKSIKSLRELTLECLGDLTTMNLHKTSLVLGGGLMMSEGFKNLLLDVLQKENVTFKNVITVDDAAGEGARALSRLGS
ncbi:uncharacterized protein L201_001306 [Kwoniella dendrophila CBS 6074]|uniref:N-acetyl-D-glucosamine kinase n=1 Tax=Kwoniella dendrophila CBS 6074 TaxID=1295534 RepID=A0AAX4JM04_9TREE